MKYELNGISVPFGGISWTKNTTGKDLFQNLFVYLEGKRILVNPIEIEKKEWCIESVLEIKSVLSSASQGKALKSFDYDVIRALIDSCNQYLDSVSPLDLPGIIYKNGNHWIDSGFDSAMKDLRHRIKAEIQKVEAHYHLIFNKVIPE